MGNPGSRRSSSVRTLEAAIILLFLVQAVRVLFSVLFGLIYDTIFSEKVALGTLGGIMLLVIAAFLTPLAAPRRDSRLLLAVTALIAALARIPLTINQPAVRLWSSLIIVGAAGTYAVGLLHERPRTFPTALLLAFVADQFLRAAGNTYDIGLRPWWLPVQVVLSLATCAAAWWIFAQGSSPRHHQPAPPAEESIGLVGGLAIGALLFLETSLLGFPNALARWSSVNYAIVAPLLMAVTLLALMPGIPRTRTQFPSGLVGWLGLLLLTLAQLVVGKRQSNDAAALLGLLLAQYLVLLPLHHVVGPRRRGRPGLALALGLLLFLVLNFALAFAFTYPYTIPAFRDRGVAVFAAAAVLVYAPTIVYTPAPRRPVRAEPPNLRPFWVWSASTLILVALVVAFAWPRAFAPQAGGPVRVGTYNVHYGYNTSWQFTLEDIARTIEESGADVVMLQEVDACRITSYGVDDGLWLARRLGMQEVYGPALEELSGIALLTRFPIAESGARLLTSQLEQTSIVHARVRVGNRPLDAYGVWMGLEPEERARQLDDVLDIIGAATPAVLGGDFNSTPDSPVYARLRAAGFEDPFVAGGFDAAPTDPAVEPVARIDFVWARGLEVRDAQVLDSLASDHRMVVVELVLGIQ